MGVNGFSDRLPASADPLVLNAHALMTFMRSRVAGLVDRAMRRAALAVLTAAAVCVVVVSSPALAQEPRERRDYAAWLDAVNTHVPGGIDDALRRIVPWSRGELESLLPLVSRHAPDERVPIVERALVLHADIALAYRLPGGGYRDLAAGQRTVTLFRDGQAVGETTGTFHWEFARRLLERLPRSDDRLRIGRQYYRATAAVLQTWGEYPELTPHLAAARRLLGEDAVLLMYEGTRHQAYAGPRVQRFFDEQRRARPIATTGRLTSSAPPPPPAANSSYTQAERLFRRALEIDPSLVEARIRLAHVLSARGRHDRAAEELTLAIGEPLPPLLDYYASLIAGIVARARDDADAARLAFERAATTYPHAPAPWYGLSELAVAHGDRTLALEHLLRANSSVRVDEHEPWWWLDRTHWPLAIEQIDQMRLSVPR